jgi:lipoprotein-anchoring transpeptidase ErfK/SrfK
MERRKLLFGSVAALFSAVAARPVRAENEPLFFFEDLENALEDDAEYEDYLRRRKALLRRRLRAKETALKRTNANGTGKVAGKRPAYKGRTDVAYFTFEKPGTIIVKTRERALYQVLGDGRARRYLVAVGREGFGWRGTARVGMKRENPTWTPPAEMIEREPRYEKWVDGMPGGIPENPLGVRALYLYKGNKDTLFRIHGTNAPSSIGTAASSGCIRMLNKEVVELYRNTPVGTKVVVS